MGRIAEALKRAQKERQERLRSSGDAEAGGSGIGAVTADGLDLIAGPMAGEAAAGMADPPLMPVDLGGPSFSCEYPLIPGEQVGPGVVALHEPSSAIAERYRSARTRLLTTNPTGSARIYAVTSPLPREGRTITVANLAFSLAELKHLRVAMVDLDFRSRGLSRLFGVSGHAGAAEVLKGEKRLCEVCTPAVRDNLFLVAAGQIGEGSPSDLLACGRMNELFRDLRERFHYTLVDTPPINNYADIGLIGPMCHSMLIVIRMNRTPEPLLRRSVKLLQANQLSITGCILAGYAEDGRGCSECQEY